MSGGEPEAGLLARALAGDAEAFAALCEQHRERVWRVAASVARGVEAEDLAQDAIVRAYASLGGYRGEAPFGAWLCRIAVNAAHDWQRSAWRRRVTLTDAPPAPEGESVWGAAERREVQRRVRQEVARLPESQRVPIWLHYFEGYPLAEVARLEGASESTVRARVRAGLRRLSLALEDLNPPVTAAPLAIDGRGCTA